MRRADHLEDIIQRCLERIENGATIDACLRDYPSHTADITPILEAAQQLRSWKIPPQSAASRAAVRDRAHAALAVQQTMPRRSAWHHTGRMVWRYAAAFAVILALFGTSVAAAQDDIPGDVLYSVKLGSEQVRLGLARTPSDRANLHLNYAQRRLNECLALQAANRSLAGSLVAIEKEYARAWDAIGLAAPDKRGALIERYQTDVQNQQAAVSTVLSDVPSGTARTTLEQILETMRETQQRIGTLNTIPLPQATPAAGQSAVVTPTASPAQTASEGKIGITTTTPVQATVGLIPATVTRTGTVSPTATPQNTRPPGGRTPTSSPSRDEAVPTKKSTVGETTPTATRRTTIVVPTQTPVSLTALPEQTVLPGPTQATGTPPLDDTITTPNPPSAATILPDDSVGDATSNPSE